MRLLTCYLFFRLLSYTQYHDIIYLFGLSLVYDWIQGPLVYVNYGSIDDFFYLTRNLSLNLSNHICISRYGAIYRGDKVYIMLYHINVMFLCPLHTTTADCQLQK